MQSSNERVKPWTMLEAESPVSGARGQCAVPSRIAVAGMSKAIALLRSELVGCLHLYQDTRLDTTLQCGLHNMFLDG